MQTTCYRYGNGWAVILSEADKHLGITIGTRNYRQNPYDFRGLVTTEQGSQDTWIGGIFGEIAVARKSGLPWSGDVAEDVPPYQVKTVEREHHRLFIPQGGRHQEPNQIYISVLYRPEYLYIRGWASVYEIKQHPMEKLLNQERNSVWPMPNNELHPMFELKEFQ